MKKIYALAPLTALAVFGGFYWNYQTEAAVRIRVRVEHEQQVREDKLRADHAARTKAQADAAEATAQRNRERDRLNELDAARKKERNDAEQRRVAALTYENAQRQRVDRLRREVETMEAAIARTEEQKRILQDEQRFLADYMTRAEKNRRIFIDLVEKLETAEKIRPTPQP